MGKDRVIEATSKLPFAGRHVVKSMYLSGREAARDGNHLKKAGSMAFLGFMVAVHAYQANLGVDVGIHHAHQDGVLNTAEAGYDGLYATANTLVTYTQLRLLGKLAFTGRRQETQETVAMPDEVAEPNLEVVDNNQSEAFTSKNLPLDLAVTLGGQALLLANAVM